MSEKEILDKYISENYQWALNDKDIDINELEINVKNTLGFAMYNASFRLNECCKTISDYLNNILN